MRYLYPCKPNEISAKDITRFERDPRWIAEIKRNGWRLLVEKDRTLTLWTRYQTVINAELPSIRESLAKIPDGTMLDGELLFTKRIKGIPDEVYLFDILYFDGNDLTGDSGPPLITRRKMLLDIYNKYLAGNDQITITQQVQLGKRALFDRLVSENNKIDEGIVLKDIYSTYKSGLKKCPQNAFWLKVLVKNAL